MGNKQVSKRKRVPIKPYLKLKVYKQEEIKIITSEELSKLKHMWKKLKSQKNVNSTTKLELIKKALPGVKIWYESLKLFYSLDKVIMATNFGTISKAYCKRDLDTEVLVKIINLEKVTSHIFLIVQGLVQMQKVNHPNICKVRSILYDEDKLYLIMDYNNEVSLADFVTEKDKLDEDAAQTIVQQILETVIYMNTIGICHRDLRPENILINPEDLQIKFPNFEFSSFYEEAQILKTKLGSAYYMAPEVIEKNYNKQWDMWSIGCIAYFLQTGFPPFLADVPSKVIEEIKNFNLNFVSEDWNGRSNDSLEFIKNTLVIDPNERLNAENAIDHPWMKSEIAKIAKANPQEICLDMNDEDFDIFLREIFAIMIENFDQDLLISLK